MTQIGGHPGLIVQREEGGIRKIAFDEINRAGILNEARMLRLLASTPYAPKLLWLDEGAGLMQEDVGLDFARAAAAGQVLVEDGERFRRNSAKLLWALRAQRVRHGDATPPNLTVRPGDVPCLIDWQQSHTFDEPFPDERHHTSDSYLLWRTIAGIPSRLHPTPDTPRIIRRWMAVSGDLGGWSGVDSLAGKRLLDLGCFMGDFCGMAAADGMEAVGIDRGGFSAGIDSIKEGTTVWGNMVDLIRQDVTEVTEAFLRGFDVVLLFSTWPYVLAEYGREAADALVERIVRAGAVLYFETQLVGDGPGPAFFVEDGDVLGYLSQFGIVRSVVTIPVTGRTASRTVWRIER